MPRLDIETRRAQLVDAASRIALRDGLENTTVRRVASEAGVSLGTVHYCFENKSALLEAVVESLIAREVRASQLTIPDGVTPVDAVRAAFRMYWDNSGAQTDYQRLIYELVTYLVRQEAPGPKLARKIFAANYATVEGFLSRFGAHWGAQFDLPTEVLSRMIIALTDGVALAWLADGDEEKALAVLDTFADLLTARLAPSGASSTRE